MIVEFCPGKTPKEIRECNGGSSCCVYKKPDQVKGSDKPDHAKRSEYHQKNHAEHWKKVDGGR